MYLLLAFDFSIKIYKNSILVEKKIYRIKNHKQNVHLLLLIHIYIYIYILILNVNSLSIFELKREDLDLISTHENQSKNTNQLKEKKYN
jgi:hypothetical protein